jgi:glutamyl-tRNA reductase
MMGLNHTTAPVHIREQVTAANCQQDDTFNQLYADLDSDLFAERCILSTCNRTEIYSVTFDRARAESVLRSLFSGQQALAHSGVDYVYAYADREVVAHLFAVASGLDSMILGEFEILGQVRNAYLNAAERKSVGPILHHLFKDAIHSGKRAHAETAIGTGAASVAYATVALARERLGVLAGKNALIIGAGDMGCRAARNLAEDGACTVMVTNRTHAVAVELAEDIRGKAIRFEQLAESLAKADLVISATGAPHIILDAATVQAAMNARPDRPLCLMDIAVPRDIDHAAANIPNVHLLNIDDMQDYVDANRAVREKAITAVRAIIEQEVEAFWRWFVERRAAPVIAGLRHRAETIRTAELDKALRRLGHLHLSKRDQQVISALSAGIVSKLLAAPTTHLKERVQSGDGQVYLETLRDLFELDSNEHPDLPSAF